MIHEKNYSNFKDTISKFSSLISVNDIYEKNIVGHMFLVLPKHDDGRSICEDFCDFLKEKNLFNFEGKKEVLKYVIDTTQPHLINEQLERLISDSGRFGKFRGVVYIDVSQLNNPGGESIFTQLIKLCSAHKDNIIFIFAARDDYYSHNLFHIAFKSLNLTKIVIEGLMLNMFMEKFLSEVNKFDLEIDDGIHNQLNHIVSMLEKTDDTNGSGMVELIVSDIIKSAIEKSSSIAVELIDAYISGEQFRLRMAPLSISNKIGF